MQKLGFRFHWLAGITCWVLLACSVREKSESTAECPAQTPDSAAGSGSFACKEDAECPSGTSCAQIVQGGNAAVSKCADVASCICRPQYFRAQQRDQLLQGFGVGEFELHVTPGVPTQFSWLAPEDASTVICGLFVASPEVQGGNLGRIVNADQALYRTHNFRISGKSALAPQAVSFTAYDLKTAFEPRTCEESLRFKPSVAATAYPIISLLRIGCWATNSSGIIAATQLEEVELSDVPEVSPPVIDCAGPADQFDGRYCYPQTQTGVCIAETCKPLPEPNSAIAQAAPDGVAGDTGGGGDGGAINSAAPVDRCAGQRDNVLCKRTPTFTFGRCFAGFCNPTPETSPLELPLVVSSCAPQSDASADTNWLNCFDRGLQGFGSCLLGSCRKRCLSDNHCAPGSDQVCFKQVADRTRLACEAQSGTTPLGVCVPRHEQVAQCK